MRPDSASEQNDVYEGLAFDYDGTLASGGLVAAPVMEALSRLKRADNRLLLVTGRRLEELLSIFPHADLFDRIVAENGGVLFRPSTGERLALSAPPPAGFVELLRSRGVEPLELGLVIVATREPQESVVLEVIRQLGLELQVIFNKGAVMVLPPGVNKASGLNRALQELDLSSDRVVGVGDAENDHAFLDSCGLSVAVANALPALKEHADLVTSAANGAGVLELVDRLLNHRLPARKRPRRPSSGPA